jgi:hypothetical protein
MHFSFAQRVLCSLLSALIISWTLPALAQAAPDEVVYLGDVEGKLSRLTTFLEGSGAFVHNGAQWDLKPGKKLVFSGDAIDRGDNGREVLRQLLDLKKRYPDRVVFTLGNRDIMKLVLSPELSDANMAVSIPPYDQWLADNHIDARLFRQDKPTKLRWMLSAIGAKAAFEDYRTELRREGKPAGDQDVLISYLADLKSGGLLASYLESAQLAYVDAPTGTLFVHGAANEENFGRLPEHPAVRLKRVGDWVTELNRWSKAEVAKGIAQAQPSVNGAQALVDSIMRDPTTHSNHTSVVTARYFDDKGVPGMPSDALIAKLKSQGVRRIAVGHTPTGEIPLVMVRDGFEIVMADQSFNSSGKSGAISITEKGVKMSSELPGVGMVFVDTANGIPEHVGQLLPSGELVAGKLASGEIVLFKKDASFKPGYRVVTAATVRTLLRPGSCAVLFN